MNFYESVKKNLKESWFTFRYTSGGNPYIAKSEKERDRLLKKYKGKVKQTGPESYTVDDKEPEWGPPADLDLDKELKEEEFQGDPNDDPDWHPESRRPDKDAVDVVWPSDDKLYMQWRDPDGKPYSHKITVADYKKLSIDDKMALDDKIKKEYGPIGSFGVDMSKVRPVKKKKVKEAEEPAGEISSNDIYNGVNLSFKSGGEQYYAWATWSSNFDFDEEVEAGNIPEGANEEDWGAIYFDIYDATGADVSGALLVTDKDAFTPQELADDLTGLVGFAKPTDVKIVENIPANDDMVKSPVKTDGKPEYVRAQDVPGIEKYLPIMQGIGMKPETLYYPKGISEDEIKADILSEIDWYMEMVHPPVDINTLEQYREQLVNMMGEGEKIDWKKEEKQLMSDMTKVNPKALKQFHKTFKDQGKTKFAERTKREMDRRGLKESSGELEELVRREFADGKAPDEIQYNGKTYKAFNVMDMGRASDSSLIYYCNMENTPSGDPQESDDYFMVNTTLKLNPDGKGFKGVKEINYIDDLTEAEESVEDKLKAKKEEILKSNPKMSMLDLNSKLEDYAYDELGVHNDNITKCIDKLAPINEAEDVEVMGFKNQYNTTIKQVRIDNKNKTYKVGMFKVNNDKKLSRKDFYNKLEELQKQGYKELKESQKLKESSNVIWSSEVTEDDYDPEWLEEQYEDYKSSVGEEDDLQSFDEWKDNYIANDDGYAEWEIKQDDLKMNIVPMIDKQVNNDILIVSGDYNSNYPDFRPSGGGGKLLNGADDLMKWLQDEDRVDFVNNDGVLGVAGYDHDGSIKGNLYTLPDDPEILLQIAKSTDYYSADDSDEEILEEFKYDVAHDYYDMRDFFPVADKFVPIKVEW